MKKLKSKAGRITKHVTFKLTLVDGMLLLSTPTALYQLNDTKLRIDGSPRDIINYLLNEKPGTIVTREELRTEAKVVPPLDLRQILHKAGINDTIRSLFVSHFSKNSLTIFNEITIPKSDAENYIYFLENKLQ